MLVARPRIDSGLHAGFPRATDNKALIFTQFRRMGHMLASMIQHDLDTEIMFFTAFIGTYVVLYFGSVDARGRSGLSMDSYGQEVRVTHIGTFEVSAGISEGDLVKFEDGPEAGRHFLVKIESNVRDHHLEPFLELQIDHTTNDTIGGL